MIWQLLLAVLLLLLLTAACLFWPRRAARTDVQTPLQQFEDRLQLLVLARDSGELAASDFDSAAQELKSQFLVQQQQRSGIVQRSWRLSLATLLAVLLLVLVVYATNGHYRQLAQWQLAQQNLQSYGERALLGQGEPLTEQEVDLFALALRTRQHRIALHLDLTDLEPDHRIEKAAAFFAGTLALGAALAFTGAASSGVAWACAPCFLSTFSMLLLIEAFD